MTILDQPAELTWGGVVLHSDADVDTPYQFQAMIGTQFGNPVPIVEVLRSHLTDGELVRRTGWGNRESVPVYVMVSAPDGQKLAQGEAALAQEFMADDGYSPLLWTSPTVEAWSLALEVVHVVPERDWPIDENADWSFRERHDNYRIYKLDFTTLPFSRDVETTVIPALPVPADPDEPALYELLDDCTTTTNWTSRFSPTTAWSSKTLASSGGKVRASGVPDWDAVGNYPRIGLRRAFPGGLVIPAGMEYLTVDFDVDAYGGTGAPWVRWNWTSGSDGEIAGAVGRTSLGGGVTRLFFEIPILLEPITSALFDFEPVRGRKGVTPTLTRYLDIYELGFTDRIAVDGTAGFQVARTAVIEGTAPTGAAISVDSGTDPLIGSTALVYTGSSPVVPLRTACSNTGSLGGLVVDDTKMSGATNNLSVPMEFQIPASQLADSTYTFLARLSFTGEKVVDWSARMVDNAGVDIPGSEVVVSGSMLLRNDTADPWRIHAIAQPRLPVILTEGGTDMVELTLSMSSGGSTVTIDEGWLADTDNGAVTLVHEPSAAQLVGIELRSAQLDAPRPSVYGTWSDGRVQDITRLTRIGTHRLKPGLVHIFTATDLAKYAAVVLEYFRRYFLHPGPSLPTEDPEA